MSPVRAHLATVATFACIFLVVAAMAVWPKQILETMLGIIAIGGATLIYHGIYRGWRS